MALSPEMFEGAAAGGIMAVIAGFLVFFIILIIALYVYSALALMAIAKRTGTPNGYLAWIPIANVYLITQIGKQSGWWTLGLLVGVIPFLGGLALVALEVFLFWKLAEACKKPGWWGVLTLIPVANLVILGILAWGKD